MRVATSLVIWLLAWSVNAQSLMRFERIGLEQGLSQSSVYTMLQDTKGFIWIGTQDGLNRYDGYQFKVFRHVADDPHSIINSDVLSLYQQDDDSIWVGTNLGLCRFNLKTVRFKCMQHESDNPQSLSANRIHAINEDGQGNLWVGTYGGGINIYNAQTNQFKKLRHNRDDPLSLSSDKVDFIFRDSKNRMWVGTFDGGLNRYDGEQNGFTHFNHKPDDANSISVDKVSDMIEDGDGIFWLATDGGGLNRYDEKNNTFTRYMTGSGNAIADNKVWKVYEDSRGELWISHESGLNKFDRENGIFTHYSHQSGDQQSLSHNAVHSILEDDSGVMWFGTYGGGISKHNVMTEQFGHYRNIPWDKNSLSDNTVMYMFIDRAGKLWLATRVGINIFDFADQRFTAMTHQPDNRNSIAGDRVRTIYQDSRGKMWFAVWDEGISIYDTDDTVFEHYTTQSGLLSTRVTNFYQTDDDSMWMSTLGDGLIHFDMNNQTFEHYPYDNEVSIHDDRNIITTFWVDENGIFWLATDGGLVKFNPKDKSFSAFEHASKDPDSISNNNVTSILKDSRGQMWLGTYGGGINLFDPSSGRFRHYTQKDGLTNDSVYGILEDNLGFLWVSTNNGLSRFDPLNLTFTNYKLEDGLQSNEFNGLAFVRSNRGELFFGGVNGFNRFFGENIRHRTQPPKVVFTDLLRFNQPVPVTPQPQPGNIALPQAIEYTKDLTLTHEDDLVTFRFAALDYASPKSNRYQYRLQGFDDQWITTGAQNRRATYTNLPPGNYTLQVKAANPHGVWNEQGTSIDIKVLSPPWLSWWALMIYALMFGLFVAFILYLGLERRKVQFERAGNKEKEQMDKIKEAFLTNTAQELRSPLSGIIGLAQSLNDGVAGALPDKANKNLAMIVASGRRLNNLVNDMLDFSKLANDSMALNTRPLDLYALADVVLNITQPLLGRKELLLANRVPKDLPKVMGDENRLQQVLYNLVDNAIKFTPRGHISISGKLDGDAVEISVVDSGIGISKEKLARLFDRPNYDSDNTSDATATGLGLTIAKQLLNLHGSAIKVQSRVGQGATFSFSLPVSSAQNSEKTTAPTIQESQSKVFRRFEHKQVSPQLPEHGQSEQAERFKLLLVDDEAVNLEVLHDHLSLQNYQLVKTRDPQKALTLLEQKGPFDLVVMDIMMSGMSGFELCKKVREIYPIQDLPIILLSHRNEAQDLAQCYSVGANDCLSKPISRHELLVRVASHLKMLDITRNLERKVAERTEQLEQQKFEIEQKVAQRTADLEQSYRSLSALSQICSEISAILDWDKLMLSVYEHIKELMETEVFMIGLYQPERQRVSFELAIECDELLPNSYVAMYEKNRPAIWCIENKQPLIINDFYEEFSYYFGDQPIPEPKVGGKPLSVIVWPLMAGGRVLGVMSVQSFHKNAYTYAELEVIRTVASTTAIALDNAQAYREIEMQKTAVEAKVAQRTEQLELKNKEILATQQQLVQSEKMASLGTLTAGVAHEINNPTNFVHVSAQNLEVDLSRFEQFILALAGDDADEEILQSFEQQFKPLHDHIKTIKDGTTRIKGIVKDLRAFTHLDADDKQLVHICETLESTINLTKTQFLELAEVVTEFNGNPELLCYPAQLSQVFMNLIVNACDAIREKQAADEQPQRGKIIIGLKEVDRGIEISFQDNGNGMSEVTQNKLFEPFYTTKAVGEGTGLGLSISYSIVEKHQGEMKVSSTLGEGTTFTLFLPTN